MRSSETTYINEYRCVYLKHESLKDFCFDLMPIYTRITISIFFCSNVTDVILYEHLSNNRHTHTRDFKQLKFHNNSLE